MTRTQRVIYFQMVMAILALVAIVWTCCTLPGCASAPAPVLNPVTPVYREVEGPCCFEDQDGRVGCYVVPYRYCVEFQGVWGLECEECVG